MKNCLRLSVLSASIVLAVSTLTSTGFASESATNVDGITLNNCTSWTSIRDANGFFAYGCSGYPFRENVAEYYSTDRALRDANQKIADLTRRVEALEKKLSASE